MVEMSDLDGLDPYDLLDAEARRIESYLSTLPDGEWQRPSRCAGWSVRAVAAHLLATEEYHRSCLDGRVASFIEAATGQGAGSLAEINDRGIAALSGLSNVELLGQWSEDDTETRRRMRERDGGELDTSVGAYPVRLQAFHVASELAVHADDMGVPVAPVDEELRRSWRARFSRFALEEERPGTVVGKREGATVVAVGGSQYTLDDDDLVEAVAGRLGAGGGLPDEARAALTVTP